MSPRSSHYVAATLAIAFAAACGGTSAPSDSGAGGVINCASDPRAMTYTPGLAVMSSAKEMKFTLLSSNPAPPARVVNTWKLSVASASGQALTSLSLQVEAFMPDHGHGSSAVPQVATNPDGTYTISNLYLFMPGIWRITFAATPPGGTFDSGAFYFCIPG
jgi:hypothetical protein